MDGTTVEVSGFLTALFEGSSDGLCLVAPDGTVLRANQQWLRSTGLFAEQVIGADIVELFPEARALAMEVHARARRGERVKVPVHRQVILGRETWWDGSVAPVPMDAGVGLLITARELVRGPTAADLARARLDALDTRTNEIELVVRLDGRLVHVNDRAVASYGYTREELLAMDLRRLRQAAPSDLVARQVAAASAGGIRFEAVHVRKDGSSFPVEVSSRAFEAGGERYLHSIVRDLTERKAAEAALRESEGRLARALDGSQDGFFDVDLATGASRRSDRFARLLGLDPAAIPQTLEGFYSVVWPEDLPALRAAIDDLLAGRSAALDHAYRVRHADGSLRWFRSRGRVTGLEGGAPGHFAGTVSEITEQVRSEAALREALAANQKLVQGLRDTLAHVRTLKGLLPICMHCHKIRNDKGYWDRIEQYVEEHSEAAFSHSVCPECLDRHYPDRGDR